MFSAPDKDRSLTQGDIIDACPVVGLSAQGSLTDLTKVSVNQWASRVIVLTQACDLVRRHVHARGFARTVRDTILKKVERSTW